MISIGKKLKKDVRAEITNMDQPLGRMIGNKNKVKRKGTYFVD